MQLSSKERCKERPKPGFESRTGHKAMENEFEVIDKTGKKIYLPKRSWAHIAKKHPIMLKYIEEIKSTLKNPTEITDYSLDENVRYYYQYIKSKEQPYKYLVVVVKYLNGKGFIITSYFEKRIK